MSEGVCAALRRRSPADDGATRRQAGGSGSRVSSRAILRVLPRSPREEVDQKAELALIVTEVLRVWVEGPVDLQLQRVRRAVRRRLDVIVAREVRFRGLRLLDDHAVELHGDGRMLRQELVGNVVDEANDGVAAAPRKNRRRVTAHPSILFLPVLLRLIPAGDELRHGGERLERDVEVVAPRDVPQLRAFAREDDTRPASWRRSRSAATAPFRRARQRHGALVQHLRPRVRRLEVLDERRHREADEELIARRVEMLANGAHPRARTARLVCARRSAPARSRSTKATISARADDPARGRGDRARDAVDAVGGEDREHRDVADREAIDR